MISTRFRSSAQLWARYIEVTNEVDLLVAPYVIMNKAEWMIWLPMLTVAIPIRASLRAFVGDGGLCYITNGGHILIA